MQKPLCDFSIQKLCPFVSAHARAFPTFNPMSKSTPPSRFYYTTAFLLRNLGLFPTSVIFQAFPLLNSVAVSANKKVFPSKLEHGFIEFLGREQLKARLHGHVLCKNILSKHRFRAGCLQEPDNKLSKSGIKKKIDL